jgi:hypothetical protein
MLQHRDCDVCSRVLLVGCFAIGVSVGEALARLRAYAFGNNVLLTEVAEAIVTRTLRFDGRPGEGPGGSE